MNELEELDQIDRLLWAFPAGTRAEDPEQAIRNHLLPVQPWELYDVTAVVPAPRAGHP